MFATKPEIVFCDGARLHGGRNVGSTWRQQTETTPREAATEQLNPDFTGQDFGEQRGDRVPDLLLNGAARSKNHHVIGKRLDATEFAHRELSTFPVERTNRRAGLRLQSPGRQAFGELEQEAPVPSPPAEQGLAFTAVRME